MYIKFYHRANNRGKYADGSYTSLIDDKEGHIPSIVIMFTCTAFRHALLMWQKNTCVHPKTSKSNLNADRPECAKYFNFKNVGGLKASCCAATRRELLTSPGVADTYTFVMNTSNPLPESYQQGVYKKTPATVMRQIQQVENPKPAKVISMEAALVHNASHLDYLTFEVALEEPDIGSTDPNIPIDINCTDDELHFGILWARGDYEHECDESINCNAIPTACLRRWPIIELERFNLGTNDRNA